MKKGLKIYLFRHGQTTFNRDKKFTGWIDPGLTTLGKKQARTVALKLKNKKFEVAIETKLKRSRQTMDEVLKFHKECKKIIVDNRMIERNYGKLNGSSHEDFIKRAGKQLLDLESEGDAIADLSLAMRKRAEKFLGEEEYEAIHRGFNVAAQGGESFAMVEKRVNSFIKDLKVMMRKEKVSVAISAHGNSIRLFRKIMERANVKETVSWFIPYDKVFEYEI